MLVGILGLEPSADVVQVLGGGVEAEFAQDGADPSAGFGNGGSFDEEGLPDLIGLVGYGLTKKSFGVEVGFCP